MSDLLDLGRGTSDERAQPLEPFLPPRELRSEEQLTKPPGQRLGGFVFWRGSSRGSPAARVVALLSQALAENGARAQTCINTQNFRCTK